MAVKAYKISLPVLKKYFKRRGEISYLQATITITFFLSYKILAVQQKMLYSLNFKN